MDVCCAWCGEEWNTYGLRHDSFDYLSGSQAVSLNVVREYAHALAGDKEARGAVSRRVYVAVLKGRGCPSSYCGFVHPAWDGPYRDRQLQQLVIDGVSDDDPAVFL